jgi:hypothetical protein
MEGAKGISLRGIKYDKSELSVTGPEPSKQEAKALQNKFAVMKELERKKNQRKIYAVIGGIAACGLIALAISKVPDKAAPEDSYRSGSSGGALHTSRVTVGDSCPEGLVCDDVDNSRTTQAELQKKFQEQRLRDQETALSTKQKIPRDNRPQTPRGSGPVATTQPDDRTELQKRIEKMYTPKAKGSINTGEDSAGKVERGLSVNTRVLGAEARPITDAEINKNLKAWAKGFSSCKTQIGQQGLTLRFSIEKSGLVGSVNVVFQGNNDPEMASCIRRVLRKKIFHPLPAKQTFSREVLL